MTGLKNSVRGKIVKPECKRQLMDFSDLKVNGNITPTDIDGYIELKNTLFMFYEYKYKNPTLEGGQKLAYKNLVDIINTVDGKHAVLFLCTHNVHNPETVVMGGSCIVDRFWYKHQWYKGHNLTAKQWTDKFIEMAFPAA